MNTHRSRNLHLATRREFLSLSAKGTGLAALGAWVPAFVTDTVHAAGKEAANKDATIFVMIKLGGGNDGLNTFVPFTDRRYHEFRPTIAVAADKVRKVSDQFGFHPDCPGFEQLFKDGHLAVIQDVGYPNSSQSHFSGQDFYERAGGLEFVGTGWLGRFLDASCPPGKARTTPDPVATHISRHLPMSLTSATPQPVFSMLSSNVQQLLQRAVAADETAELIRATISAGEKEPNEKVRYLNLAYMNALITEEKVRGVISGYKAGAEYPKTTLGADMQAVAAMIAAGIGNRVYCLELGGFDTHSNHARRHAELIAELSGAMAAFLKDLKSKSLADQVLVMPFSEFGRRPYENGTAGTDHGTNSTFFVAGTKVKGGIYGKHPSIPKDRRSDIPFTRTSTDFRQIYATILDKWLGVDSKTVLRDKYKPLEFLG